MERATEKRKREERSDRKEENTQRGFLYKSSTTTV